MLLLSVHLLMGRKEGRLPTIQPSILLIFDFFKLAKELKGLPHLYNEE
jgi:hypothetical protein